MTRKVPKGIEEPVLVLDESRASSLKSTPSTQTLENSTPAAPSTVPIDPPAYDRLPSYHTVVENVQAPSPAANHPPAPIALQYKADLRALRKKVKEAKARGQFKDDSLARELRGITDVNAAYAIIARGMVGMLDIDDDSTDGSPFESLATYSVDSMTAIRLSTWMERTSGTKSSIRELANADLSNLDEVAWFFANQFCSRK